MLLTRLLLLSLMLILPLGCYPPYIPPPPPVAAVALPAVPVITPPAQSQQAAVAISTDTKAQELRAKDVALALYQQVVELTRQRAMTQEAFSKFQKLYDALLSQIHAFSVLSPLDPKLKDDAHKNVAKALADLLAHARQLKIL